MADEWRTAVTLYAAEFDSHPDVVGSVEVRDLPDGDALVIRRGQDETLLIESYRDQWGAFYFVGGITVAQEDQTRSFIDALIQCLTELKRRNEFGTNDATIISTTKGPADV